LLKRVVEVWREQGAKSLWFKGLGKTVYRRAVLVEHRLDAPLLDVTPSVPVEIGLLGEAHVDAYLAFRPDTGSTDVRSRLEKGHVCFAAWHDGRIVSAAWLATGRVWIDYLARDMHLAADEAYLYESFTTRGFRGHNIPALRGSYEARYFRDAGYRRLVAVIAPENGPALRHAEKAGWNVFGMMGYVKLGPWRRDFCRVDPASRPPDEQ
jgi:hypothetical protein